MSDPKNVVSSTTMWGAGFAVVGVILSTFGFELGVGVTEDVAQAAGAVTTAFGALWVIVERWKKGDLFFKRPSG